MAASNSPDPHDLLPWIRGHNPSSLEEWQVCSLLAAIGRDVICQNSADTGEAPAVVLEKFYAQY